MAAYKRVYRFDKELGKIVETTNEELRPVCEEIAEDVRTRSELVAPLTRVSRAKWPIHSEAMAVNREDIKRAQEELHKHGVHTDYDKDGCPILEGPLHRNKHAKVFGFYDRNAGYSDPAPDNR